MTIHVVAFYRELARLFHVESSHAPPHEDVRLCNIADDLDMRADDIESAPFIDLPEENRPCAL